MAWRAALEPALNGLIELIVHDLYKNDMSNNNIRPMLIKHQLMQQFDNDLAHACRQQQEGFHC